MVVANLNNTNVSISECHHSTVY